MNIPDYSLCLQCKIKQLLGGVGSFWHPHLVSQELVLCQGNPAV